MPLSVPLLLVPGEPDRHYTVHLHRVRAKWVKAQIDASATEMEAAEW